MRIQDIAHETLGYFKPVRTDSAVPTWRMVDNAPDYIVKLVKTAHGEYLPDDHRYRFIVEALEALSKCISIEDVDVKADAEPQMLTGWLHSKINRLNYMTRSMAGSNSEDSLKLLQSAQSIEKNEVLEEVLRQLQVFLNSKA